MDKKPMKVSLKKFTLEERYPELTISHHEEALICSAQFEMLCGYDEAVAELSPRMEALVSWVDEHDGFVGHIKAAIAQEVRSALLSTTGESVSVKGAEYSRITVGLTCIVFVKSESAFCREVQNLKDTLG